MATFCTCSGSANDPYPCPACETDRRERERLDREFGSGRLDAEYGAWLLRRVGPDDVADLLVERFGGEARVEGGRVLLLTVAAEYGWGGGRWVETPDAAIGRAFREARDRSGERFLDELAEG